MMVSVLRNLRHTDLVAEIPNLAAFLARGEARPAFQRALADQIAVFAQQSTRRRSSMTYFEGFVGARAEGQQGTLSQACGGRRADFKEFGVKRHVETWGSDVPEGKVTDFRKAVKAKRRTKTWCSPGSNIPTRRRAMRPTRR